MRFNKYILMIIALFTFSLISGRDLSLSESRKLALENNTTLKISNENKIISQYNKKAAFSLFTPAISFLADYTNFQKKIQYEKDLGLDKIIGAMGQANPALATDPFYQTLVAMQDKLPSSLSLELGRPNNYLLTFSLTQPLFTGGKIVNQYKISKDLMKISESGYLLKQEEVILDVDENYFRVLNVMEKVKLAEAYKNMLAELVNNLENMQLAGLITSNEILKAKVKYSEAELNIFKAKNGLKLAKMSLNKTLGLRIEDEVNLTDSLLKAEDYSYVFAKDETINNRPEIKSLNSLLDINAKLISITKSRYLPNLVLQGNYNFINPNPYNSMEPEFGNNWQIGLIGQMELFHGNDTYYQLATAKHNKKVTEFEIQEAKEKITLELEQAKLKYEEAKQYLSMAENNLSQAVENLRVCKDKFEEGLLTSSEVLEAQTLWQQAFGTTIEAKTDLRITETKLKKALGLLALE